MLVPERDTDGVMLVRLKAAKYGWTFTLLPIECTTAKVGGIYSKLPDGSDRPGITMTLYDASDAVVTDPANEAAVVKTVVDFEPPYNYEIIGGQLQQHTIPTQDIRMWVVAVPDVPAVAGGSKEMICGINLRYVDPTDKVSADGRVSKHMSYNPTYHTNKIRVILKHPAGLQHDTLITFELYKE